MTNKALLQVNNITNYGNFTETWYVIEKRQIFTELNLCALQLSKILQLLSVDTSSLISLRTWKFEAELIFLHNICDSLSKSVKMSVFFVVKRVVRENFTIFSEVLAASAVTALRTAGL
jgi:hypothetical protein